MAQNPLLVVRLGGDTNMCAGTPISDLWSALAANPWVLVALVALLLGFLYAITMLVLRNRKLDEDVSVRLMWILKVEIRGSARRASKALQDHASVEGLQTPKGQDTKEDTHTDRCGDIADGGGTEAPERCR